MKMLSIFDGHNDTLLHLYYQDLGGGRSFFLGWQAYLDTRRILGKEDLPIAWSI